MIPQHAVTTPDASLAGAFTNVLTRKLTKVVDWSPVLEEMPDALGRLTVLPDALKTAKDDDVMNCLPAASLILRLATAEGGQNTIPHAPDTADYRLMEPVLAKLASRGPDGLRKPLVTRDEDSGAWRLTEEGLEAAMAFSGRLYDAFMGHLGECVQSKRH